MMYFTCRALSSKFQSDGPFTSAKSSSTSLKKYFSGLLYFPGVSKNHNFFPKKLQKTLQKAHEKGYYDKYI